MQSCSRVIYSVGLWLFCCNELLLVLELVVWWHIVVKIKQWVKKFQRNDTIMSNVCLIKTERTENHQTTHINYQVRPIWVCVQLLKLTLRLYIMSFIHKLLKVKHVFLVLTAIRQYLKCLCFNTYSWMSLNLITINTSSSQFQTKKWSYLLAPDVWWS